VEGGGWRVEGGGWMVEGGGIIPSSFFRLPLVSIGSINDEID
jgi:hypothetical protein